MTDEQKRLVTRIIRYLKPATEELLKLYDTMPPMTRVQDEVSEAHIKVDHAIDHIEDVREMLKGEKT